MAKEEEKTFFLSSSYPFIFDQEDEIGAMCHMKITINVAHCTVTSQIELTTSVVHKDKKEKLFCLEDLAQETEEAIKYQVGQIQIDFGVGLENKDDTPLYCFPLGAFPSNQDKFRSVKNSRGFSVGLGVQASQQPAAILGVGYHQDREVTGTLKDWKTVNCLHNFTDKLNCYPVQYWSYYLVKIGDKDPSNFHSLTSHDIKKNPLTLTLTKDFEASWQLEKPQHDFQLRISVKMYIKKVKEGLFGKKSSSFLAIFGGKQNFSEQDGVIKKFEQARGVTASDDSQKENLETFLISNHPFLAPLQDLSSSEVSKS